MTHHKFFRIVPAALALMLAGLTSLAQAGDIRPYSQQEFDRLAQAGQSVVVDVSAPWCPTCKAQKPVIDRLSGSPAYKDVTILAVDFDHDKDTLTRHKVRWQSTLIAFHGGREVARSVGETRPDAIEGVFSSALH